MATRLGLKRVSAFTKLAVGGKEDTDDGVARFREPSALAFRGVGLLRHADRSVLICPSINKEIIYCKLNMETGQLRSTAICEGWAYVGRYGFLKELKAHLHFECAFVF